MRVVIFGASGRTGRLLVEQALEAGHEVTAVVRDPARLGMAHARLRVITGDVLDPAVVDRAVAGQDAVLSALGQTPDRPSSKELLSLAARHIVSAMKAHGVRRLVFLTGAGVKQPEDPPSFAGLVIVPLLKLLSGDVLRDAEQAARTIQASDLDWTLVRAPRLGDGPATGAYRTGYIRAGFQPVPRADVTDFMLRQLSDDRYPRQAPIISR